MRNFTVKNVGRIVVGCVVGVAIAAVAGFKPRPAPRPAPATFERAWIETGPNGQLSKQQLMEITDYCNQHPDALRCR